MSVTTQPVSTFTVTVTGRTLTPVGTVAINDLRPRTPTGPLTFAGIVNGAQFDIYALAAANNQYTLLALPSGTSIVGRSDVLLLGGATDYPSTGTCQWFPVAGGALDTYFYVAADGMHLRAFGNLGYGQMVLESPGRVNDTTINSTATQTTITSPKSLIIVCSDTTWAGLSMIRGGAASLIATVAGSAATVQSILGGVALLGATGVSISATAGNVGIGASSGGVSLSSSGADIDIFPGGHQSMRLHGAIASSGSSPTIAVSGTSLGTGGSAAIVGDDNDGYISLTTGSAAVNNNWNIVANVTFASSRSAAPKTVHLDEANINAAALARNQDFWIPRGFVFTTGFSVACGGFSAPVSTTFEYYYWVVGG